MDVPLYLLFGLVTGGYLLRNKKRRGPGNTIGRGEAFRVEPHRLPSGENILGSTHYEKSKRLEEEAASVKFQQAYSGEGRVIPYFFGWLEDSSIKRQANPDYDPNILRREIARWTQAGSRGEKVAPDDGVPDIVGELANGNANYGTVGHKPGGFTGEVSVPRGHNNMVPFFGGSLKQNMKVDNIMAEQKLEAFTGHYKLEQQHRQEIPPMFTPTPQNLDGLVPLRETDRVVPSNLGKRNNELPFEQVRVGPGLNMGYTAAPSGGFHNPVRILPKDNDELHVNPRTTHEGRVLRGKGPVPARTSQGLAYKYRPETLVTNFDGERNFVTTGQVKNPIARPKTFVRPTARQQFREVKGPLGANWYNRPESLFAKTKVSDRQNFKNTPYRNAHRVCGEKGNMDAHYNYENRRNERSVTGTRSVIANIKSVINKMTMALFDRLRGTRKELCEGNARSCGNVAGHKYKGGNSVLEAKTTNREITETGDYVGPVSGKGQQGSVLQFQGEARATIREGTEGGASGRDGHLRGHNKGRAYDQSQLRTTIKELLENNAHQGQLVGIKKSRIVNALDQAKTTIREFTESNAHYGHLSNGKYQLGHADETQTAKSTHRETTEDVQHEGNLVGGKFKVAGGHHDEAKATHRETLEGNSHGGNVDGRTGGKLKGGNMPTDPLKTTARETLESNGHSGQLLGGKYKSRNPLQDGSRTTGREAMEAVSHNGQLTGRACGKFKVKSREQGESRTTGRETLEVNGHDGQLTGLACGKFKVKSREQGESRTTGRETLEVNGHTGQLTGRGNLKARNREPGESRTTGRETLEVNGHTGQLTGRGKLKARNREPGESRTTGRETLEVNSYAGQLTGGSHKGRHGAHGLDESRATHRETTEANSYAGLPTGGRYKGRHGGLDESRTTHREGTEVNSYAGQVTGGRQKGRTSTVDAPRATHRETTETNGHAGQLRGTYKGANRGQDESRATGRETLEVNGHGGNVTGTHKTGHSGAIDDMRSTHRETMEVQRHAGQLAVRAKGRNRESDEARGTHRETTENNAHVGQLSGRTCGKWKVGNVGTDASKTTNRETTGVNGQAGNLTGGKKVITGYEGDPAKATHRESTEIGTHQGQIQRSRKKGAVGEVQEARATGRETVEESNHEGFVNRGFRKSTLPIGHLAKVTLRETTENSKYLAHGSVHGKGRARDNQESRPTHRETTEATEYFGTACDGNGVDGKGYQIANFEDKATQRQFSHFSHTGGAGPKGIPEANQLYDAAYNARTNSNKEKVAKGRSKLNPLLALNAGKDLVNINIKKLDEDRLTQYSAAPNPTYPNGRIPEFLCKLTSFKNSLPPEFNRLDTDILEVYKKNPLTQSLNSYA